MDDREFELTKLSVLNEQTAHYTSLIDLLQNDIDRMETTKAQYANAKARARTEAEGLERQHYRAD